MIKDSTQLGYRNPPEAKLQVIHGNLKPVVDSAGYPPIVNNYRPLGQLPSDGSELSAKFGSLSHHEYGRQKSLPSLPSGSEREAAITTDTIETNQPTVSHHSPPMLLTDQPTPEASQAPSTADSKFGKTNLNFLKYRLQHKKEVTQTMILTGGTGAHPHSSGDYVNADMVQGGSDNTNKSTFGGSDLARLRDRLEKAEEERAKVASSVNHTSDYHTLSEVASYISGNPMIMKKPLPHDKKPKASPRTVVPTTNNNPALSTASSYINFKLWQCPHCQSVNEACHTSCTHCKLPHGWQADRLVLCKFCQLLVSIPARREYTDICCPRCKYVLETVL